MAPVELADTNIPIQGLTILRVACSNGASVFFSTNGLFETLNEKCMKYCMIDNA